MPVAGQLEPEALEAALGPWMARQMPDARDVRIVDVVIPQSSGFSNETFLVDAAWTDADGDQLVELVVREPGAEQRAVPRVVDLVDHQFRTMKLLGEHSDVPVARMRWAEADPALLGRPFFVMDRLHGLVPGDSPPYTTEGFVMDMDAETRRRWHRNALEAMTRVHAVDWRKVGLRVPRPGAPRRARARSSVTTTSTTTGRGPRRTSRTPSSIRRGSGSTRTGPTTASTSSCAGATPDRATRCSPAPRWSASSTGRWCRSATASRISAGGSSCSATTPTAPACRCPRACSTATRPSPSGSGCADARPTNVDFYERLGGFQFCLVMVRLAESMGIPEMGFDNPVATLTAQLIEVVLTPRLQLASADQLCAGLVTPVR